MSLCSQHQLLSVPCSPALIHTAPMHMFDWAQAVTQSSMEYATSCDISEPSCAMPHSRVNCTSVGGSVYTVPLAFGQDGMPLSVGVGTVLAEPVVSAGSIVSVGTEEEVGVGLSLRRSPDVNDVAMFISPSPATLLVIL